MTELKPRAWSKSYNAYCDFVTLDKKGKWIGWFKRCGIYLADSDIILEFPTGLKDKNGKEISEGDIVRIVSESFLEPSVGIVGFNEDKGIYDTYITENNKVYWEAGSCLCSLMGREDYTTEVIGNIHKNPELLEEKNVD